VQFQIGNLLLFASDHHTMALDYLHTDDLTILLGLISATVFLLNNLYKPQPLVHPILLGRQSDVGRARNPSESAVYRNYGTGLMGRVCSFPSFIFVVFTVPYIVSLEARQRGSHSRRLH
jgi:hypothetical protein